MESGKFGEALGLSESQSLDLAAPRLALHSMTENLSIKTEVLYKLQFLIKYVAL